MEKTINIGGKEVTFKFTLAAFYIFKNQFGYDAMIKIVPAIGDLLANLDFSLLFNKDNNNELNYEDLGQFLGEALQGIYNFEMVDFLNLIWAFAKTYDNKLPAPINWFNSFESFPLVDVLKEFIPALYESLGSKKKLTSQVGEETKKEEKK